MISLDRSLRRDAAGPTSRLPGAPDLRRRVGRQRGARAPGPRGGRGYRGHLRIRRCRGSGGPLLARVAARGLPRPPDRATIWRASWTGLSQPAPPRDAGGLERLLDGLAGLTRAQRDTLLGPLQSRIDDGRRHMATADQLRRLRDRGVAVGAHGRTHEPLSSCEDLDDELVQPRAIASARCSMSPSRRWRSPIAAYARGSPAGRAGGLRARVHGRAAAPAPVRPLPFAIGRIPITPANMMDPGGTFRPEQLALHLFRRDASPHGSDPEAEDPPGAKARRTSMKYALRGIRQNDAHEGLDRAYRITDPWHMNASRSSRDGRDEPRDPGPPGGWGRSILRSVRGRPPERAPRAHHQGTDGTRRTSRAVQRARERVPSAAFVAGNLFAQPWPRSAEGSIW